MNGLVLWLYEEVVGMFEVDCPGHGAPVLLTTRCIERMGRGSDGITVHWRCWCGALGRFLTGRARATAPIDHVLTHSSAADHAA